MRNPGGKVKPLKAPKKQQKDLDEDEIAFREKQKAGEFLYLLVTGAPFVSPRALSLTTNSTHRGQGQEGTVGKGQGQGPPEHWNPGYQEVRQEINLYHIPTVHCPTE